jgi:hypothetical protein
MRHVISRAIAALTTCLAALAALPASADVAWPTRVVAIYKVKLAGVEFGTFNFSSSINGEQYSLAGDAKLSWGMGLFHWLGTVRGSGMLGSTPLPGSYAFEFKGHDKGGSVALGFRNHDVVNVKVEPPNSPSPEHIPLKPQHLKDVFDPMSALLAVAHGSIGTPCGRRVPIFDGKQRFDLVLSFRRQEKIPEARPSGEPNVGFVCRVQYVPIAGHRDNAATRAFAANEGIEVKLRPVPSASLLVPYQIIIPTAVGSAVLQSTRVEITTPGDRRIAFTF